MKKRIYLAGPIAGLSYALARHGWREDFYEKWAAGAHSLVADLYSPMRGKDFLFGVKNIGHSPGQYDEHPMGTDAGIVTRDMNDVRLCDLMVVHLLGAKEVSRGTMVEYGWASAFGKPIITIIEKDGKVLSEGFGYERVNPHWYCMVRQLSGYIVHDLDTAVEIAATLLTPGI